MSEEQALAVKELSPEEIAEGAEALLKRPEARFLSDRNLIGDDDAKGKASLLVAYAAAEGLNPYAGEVMLFQGRPYKTLPGVIRQARQRGRVDFGPYEQPVTPEEAEQIQAQIPPSPASGEVDRAYMAKVVLKLRGSTEPQVHFSYVLESERQMAMESEKNSRYDSTKRKAAKGIFSQPIIKHTQKLALARAKRKALLDSGAAAPDEMNEMDRVAALSEIQAYGLSVETQTEPETQLLEAGDGEQLPFDGQGEQPAGAELTAGDLKEQAADDGEAAASTDNGAAAAAAEPADDFDDPFAHDEGAIEGKAEAVDEGGDIATGPQPWDPPEGHTYDAQSGLDVFKFAHELGYPQFDDVCDALLLARAGEDRQERAMRVADANVFCEMWSGPALAWSVERFFDLIQAMTDVKWGETEKIRSEALAWHQARARDGDGAYNTQAVEAAAAAS